MFWRCCWCSWQWVQTEVIQVVSLLLHLLRSDRADDAYQTWWFLNTGAWSKKTQKNGTTAIPVVKSNQCRNQSDSDALDFHTVFALKKKVVKAKERQGRWELSQMAVTKRCQILSPSPGEKSITCHQQLTALLTPKNCSFFRFRNLNIYPKGLTQLHLSHAGRLNMALGNTRGGD